MEIYLRQAQDYAALGPLAPAQARLDRLVSFWKTLSWVFGTPPPKCNTPTINVLDLACGFCEESRIVASFFSSGIAGVPTEQVRLFGIDRDDGAIAAAIAGSLTHDPFFSPERYYLRMNGVFRSGDATKAETYRELPNAFDYIIVRHQFIARDAAQFEAMVKMALERLAPT